MHRIRTRFRTAAVAVAVTSLVMTPALDSPDTAAAQTTPPIQRTQRRPSVRSDELLVKFKPGTRASSESAVHRQMGAQEVREVRGAEVKVVKVPGGQREQRLRDYRADPNVEYAEPNGIAYALGDPNDPYYPQQWALNNTVSTSADISAPQAWGVGATGNPSVRIAILDTGVRPDHPDLDAKVDNTTRDDPNHGTNLKWFRNWTTAGSADQADDHYGHGTHVAGSAAAVTNNATGLAGVCQGCLITVGKVLGDDGSGAYDWIASGVLWAVGCEIRDSADNCLGPRRAQVINLSLGGTYNSLTLQNAVNKAWSRGAVLTCAAGNNGSSARFYPAAYTNCIAVAATDNRDRKASWSNFGSWVDVAAPGVDILSALPVSNSMYTSPSGYAFWGGTSMATPHVAGLAGLLWAKGGSSLDSPSEVRGRIESTADRIARTGSYWAKGRIDACRAVGATGC